MVDVEVLGAVVGAVVGVVVGEVVGEVVGVVEVPERYTAGPGIG